MAGITLGMLKKKYSEFMERHDVFEIMADTPGIMVIGDIINAANLCQLDDDYVIMRCGIDLVGKEQGRGATHDDTNNRA